MIEAVGDLQPISASVSTVAVLQLTAIGERGGAADLKNADVNTFVHHFEHFNLNLIR